MSRFLIVGVWLGWLLAIVTGEIAHAAERPNVVVILTDDQGWGDLSINGNRNLSTPHIDSLARDGASFDRFFVCPVCSPTRAEFLTGRYHPRTGVHDVTRGGERMNLSEKTIADVFKAAGYATGAFGKWHNGSQYPYHPNGRGFDRYYGFTSGHWGHYFNAALEENGKPVQGRGFIADDFTDQALTFIEQNRERPFLCYLPYNTPHSPMQVPDKFYDKFATTEIAMRGDAKENLPMTRSALAMCENLDMNVGRVLTKLENLKLSQRTIVVYFHDNGPNGNRWNGGMKGRKGSTDEGGVRSPLFVRWPGVIKPGTTVPQIAGAIDLLPTLAALADVPLPAAKLDGVSLTPLIGLKGGNDEPTDWKPRLIFSHFNGKTSVRSQTHRLDATGQLFDMAADPAQTRNIAGEQKQIAAELTAAAAKWKQEMPSNRPDERPFPVGYPQFPTTHLPARDGTAHGKIQRSSAAPNCSYFTNWISSDDSIDWNIEVATSGRYEAVVLYTCAKENLGPNVKLSFYNSDATENNATSAKGTPLAQVTVTAPVIVAHDPPLIGKSDDRVPRGSESYVKDFSPLKLGELQLAKGRGLLKLSVDKIHGAAAIDVRGVELRLLY